MVFLFNLLFNQSRYIPHGHCYLWQSGLVGLHTIADFFIAIAYFSIPIMLIYFVKKREDNPFPRIFILFSLFIICCGLTHVMGIVTLWYPVYWVSGIVKAITAVVSILTSFELFPIIPLALALPSPEKLRAMNLELENEVKERKEAQKQLSILNGELEERVQKRTEEIQYVNDYLKAIIKVEQLISSVSNYFINVQYKCFKAHFLESLNFICSTLDYEYGYLFLFDRFYDFDTQYSFPAEGKIINLETDFPLLLKDINNLIPIKYNINNSTPTDINSQPFIIENNIKSVLAIPLVLKGELKGVLLLISRKKRHLEDIIDIDNLSLISDILVSALESYEINQQLQKQNQELKRSNEELEQFAYVASHDLQEPLRTIRSFTEILKDEYEQNFDETGKEYLNFIILSSEKMKMLIKDLLALSRVERSEQFFTLINLNEVIEEVINVLKVTIESSNVIINCQNLPIVEGDRFQLVQLWQNLITNGIKFRQQNEQVTIEIGVTEQENHWLFHIRDNGIGISDKYKERIFVIFQRLNHRYEGTGIGLALCRKIVHRHGGQIWVNSELGKGSTFYFTMPKINN